MSLSEKISDFKSAQYHYSVDILRGIAAMMVVLFHFVLGNPQRFSELSWLQYLSSCGHLGVQVFFVISGFVIPNAMYKGGYHIRNFGQFLVKRLARLEPPYLTSVLVCLLLLYISLIIPYFRGVAPSISWQQLALHIGYLNAFFHYDWLNPVYWTLAIEFQYYLIMAAIFPFLISDRRVIQAALLLVFYILALAFNQKEFIFKHAPYFIFGILLFLYKIEKVDGKELVLFFTINFLFCSYLDSLTFAAFGALAFILIILSSAKNQIGLFLGSISYSLYLLHVPVGQRIMNISENFIQNQYLMLVVMLLCILLMILVARLFYLIIERPSQLLSKKIVF